MRQGRGSASTSTSTSRVDALVHRRLQSAVRELQSYGAELDQQQELGIGWQPVVLVGDARLGDASDSVR